MPRYRDDDDDRDDDFPGRRPIPRQNPNIVVLAGVAAGLTCAVVLLGGWLLLRPRPAPETEIQRWERESIEAGRGKPNLGDAGLNLAKKINRELEEKAAAEGR